jgi:hypothetical protein
MICTEDIDMHCLTGVLYRRILPADVEGVTALLSMFGEPLAGSMHPAVHRAVCRDAANGRGVRIVIAECDGRLGGLALALVDGKRYWRRFALRHPLLALRIAAARLSRRRSGAKNPRAGSDVGDVEELAEKTLAERCWRQSGARIAKMLFVGILPDFRGKCLGRVLAMTCVSSLLADGIERVDGTISRGNVASVNLARKAGWSLRLRPGDATFLATIGAPEENRR